MSPAEVSALQADNPARWFRADAGQVEGSGGDPFEPIAGWRGYQRIRKRPDGACGCLSAANRCRLHEELGERRKPLTCRMFPYPLPRRPGRRNRDRQFRLPYRRREQGRTAGRGSGTFISIKALRTEWLAHSTPVARPRTLVGSRRIEAGSIAILRQGLLAILNRRDGGVLDLRLERQSHGRRAGRLVTVARPRASGFRLCRLRPPHGALCRRRREARRRPEPGIIGDCCSADSCSWSPPRASSSTTPRRRAWRSD